MSAPVVLKLNLIQISDFLSDYSAALSRAVALDESLRNASVLISSSYADVVALSIRQTFGALELTISGSPGAWNTSDTLMFLKGLYLRCLLVFFCISRILRQKYPVMV